MRAQNVTTGTAPRTRLGVGRHGPPGSLEGRPNPNHDHDHITVFLFSRLRFGAKAKIRCALALVSFSRGRAWFLREIRPGSIGSSPGVCCLPAVLDPLARNWSGWEGGGHGNAREGRAFVRACV